MDFSAENIMCRLCLRKVTQNYEPVEEILQHALNFLILFPNLTISDDPVMCETCAVTLKKCFDFKTRCLSTENCIASFAEGENKKVVLRDIYLKIKLDGNVVKVPDNDRVCRFCLELEKDDASMSVRHDVDLFAVLQKYFPEIDLSLTDNIIACTPCYNSLRFHLTFVNNYLSIEGKINEYCKVEGANYKDEVDLRDVAIFISKCMLNVKNISSLIIKEDKHENIRNTNDVNVKFEDPVDVKQDKEKLVHKEIQHSDNTSFQHNPYSQSDCAPQLTRINSAKHPSEIHRYQNNIIQKYTCEICTFKTNTKDCLKKHMLEHKDASEMTMYRCATCSYQGKCKQQLQVHMITHKCDTEVVLYKCDLCDYETKQKSHLNRHMITHKTRSEITLYKCDLCCHEAKQEYDLKMHVLTHKTHWDLPLYKCDLCDYEAKRKSHLKGHMLTHKTDSEATMYKCNLCAYEAKRKSDLKRHTVTHKTRSEITTFKCDLCIYEAKRKSHLKRHILTHKTHHSRTTM